MNKKVFLSHAHDDKRLAEIISSMIRRVTLNQLDVWFSSDEQSTGGLAAGSQWRNYLQKELRGCIAVIALITPASMNRPWVYFECGFGAAHAKLQVIPLCVGIDAISDIPKPLEMFQAFQLSDYSSVVTFLRKLLASVRDISFDEEMAKPVLEPTINKIAEVVAENQYEKVDRATDSLTEALREMKQHFDSRFAEYSPSRARKRISRTHSVEVTIAFPERTFKAFVEIRPNDSVGNKLNDIYFLIKDFVNPYTYLETWILQDCKTQGFLVIREIADRIPAGVIFQASSRWLVLPLRSPYLATLEPQLKPAPTLSNPNQDRPPKSRPLAPSGGGGGEGPPAPKVDKPNTEELLKRMRKVDPDKARRWRQRTGQ